MYTCWLYTGSLSNKFVTFIKNICLNLALTDHFIGPRCHPTQGDILVQLQSHVTVKVLACLQFLTFTCCCWLIDTVYKLITIVKCSFLRNSHNHHTICRNTSLLNMGCDVWIPLLSNYSLYKFNTISVSLTLFCNGRTNIRNILNASYSRCWYLLYSVKKRRKDVYHT